MPHRSQDKIDRVIRQSNLWILFGVVSPILFFILAIFLITHNYITFITASWATVAVTTLICFSWWFWSLRMMICIAEIHNDAIKDLTNMKETIIILKDEMNVANEEMIKIASSHKKKTTTRTKKTT